MEVLRAEYHREGEVSRQGQERWRDSGRERQREREKKRIKILKKEYFNEVVKENRMFDVQYIVK